MGQTPGPVQWRADMQCSRCPQENPPGARFCNSCGAGLELTCPSCHHSNPTGSQFCNRCGASLGATPTPAAPRLPSPESYTPARDGSVRRSQGLDGAARRPRSRGSAQDPRPGPRAHDGRRAPLRGHGEPGDGRRDHGAVRRTDCAAAHRTKVSLAVGHPPSYRPVHRVMEATSPRGVP